MSEHFVWIETVACISVCHTHAKFGENKFDLIETVLPIDIIRLRFEMLCFKFLSDLR